MSIATNNQDRFKINFLNAWSIFFLNAITKSGTRQAKDVSEAKNIVLINYLSIVLSCAVLILLIFRYIKFSISPDIEVIAAAILFLLPLLLNSLGFIYISSLCICWMPSIIIITVYILLLKRMDSASISQFDGIFIYLLGVSNTPFLVLNLKNKVTFALGLLVPFLVFVYSVSILEFFEVSTQYKGITGSDFEMNQMRSIIAYFILNASCLTIKWLLEEGERKNILLIEELANKNQIIEQQAKEDLQKASSRLALATYSAGIGIWEWNIKTEELIWDEQMLELFGIEDKTFRPKDWRDHIHPEDLEDMEEKTSEAIEKNKELNADFRTILPNGEIRHIETIANLYRIDQKPPHMIGVCWDISDRKISEEQLLQSQANLFATINNTTFFIWSINRNFEILNVNKPFKNYLKAQYNVNIHEGTRIQSLSHLKIVEFSLSWIRNYTRALAGESFELSEERSGRHFKHSLNPIIENAMISGVTIFTEETTELRTKELALLEANKQIGDLKLMALRSAMNPHFIFNTLNSIQYFILKNDKLNAVNYLSTFSKLIRNILNNSVSNKIRLSDELDQIKNYITLEMMRFEGKFDFDLHVAKELDLENTEISSMLIQPYIENAILHGLYNKPNKGTLKMSIKEDGDFILFEIEDDGIGREAASKYKFESNIDHKSLGTTITEERLKLINMQSGITPVIEDLYSEGEPVGTRVKVWVN